MLNEYATGSPLPLRIGIREVLTDVTGTDRSEQGIDKGMEDHVTIAVRNGASLRWDLYTAKPQ